jgi:hypothetical protein
VFTHKDTVWVHSYDVRSNAFEPATSFKGYAGGTPRSCYNPDQNAVIINGAGDLRPTKTRAYRYKDRAVVSEKRKGGSHVSGIGGVRGNDGGGH